MQTQHLIIIASGSVIVLLLMAYYIRRAVLAAFGRMTVRHTAQIDQHHARITALTADILRITRRRQEAEERYQQEIRQLKAAHLAQRPVTPPLTVADHQLLMHVRGTLLLANQTWHAMPGTEPILAKVDRQLVRLLELGTRILDAVEPPISHDPAPAAQPGAAA